MSKYTKILVLYVIGISLFMTTGLALTSDDISINNLNNGDSRAGIFEIKGAVINDNSVDKIAVRVGDGPWEVAEGTTTWKYTVNARQIVTGYKYIYDPELGTTIQKYDRGYKFGDIPITIGAFDASSNCLATKIVTPRIVPEPPTASVSTGAIDGLITVQLKSAPGVSIFYTINGNNPTETSARYNGSLSLSIPVVLKAVVKSENGYLSDILTLDYNSPSQNIPKITAGYDHTLAIKNDGKVWAWGSNTYGQLGNGSTISSYVQVPVNYLENVVTIAAGKSHSLAVKKDGTVWAWGLNSFGQLGNGITINSSIPKQVPELKNVIAVAAGDEFSLALTTDGKVWAWGKNNLGQLGDGSSDSKRNIPKQVSNLDNVIVIAAGTEHCLALKKDGTVWAWGNNKYSALGNSNASSISRIPVQVMNLTSVIAIAGGSRHSLALKKDGTVWAWGDNEYGQAGQDWYVHQFNTPLLISKLSNVIAIAGGYNHSLALTNDGKVWSWGYDDKGQLGYGAVIPKSNTPYAVSNLGVNVVAIAGGGEHSLALLNDGTVRCWGYNNNGQLGNKSKTDSNIPVIAGVPGQMPVITPYQYTLTITNDGKGTSTPTGSMVVKNGESINITANPKNDCLFNNWTKESGTGTVVFGDSTAASTTVTVTGGNATIKANFVSKPNSKFILTVENDGNGTTNPAGQQQIANYSSTAINAVSNNGFLFTNWTKTAGAGEVEFADEYAANTNVTVISGDAIIRANFVKELPINTLVDNNITYNNSKLYVFQSVIGKQYHIRYRDRFCGNVDYSAGVFIEAFHKDLITPYWADKYSYDHTITAADNYVYLRVTCDLGSGTFGIGISTQHSLTIAGSENGWNSPSGTVTVFDGIETEIEAQPAQNYYFEKWEQTAGPGIVKFGNQYGTNTYVYVTGGDAAIQAVYQNSLENVSAIACGNYSYAFIKDGEVWKFDSNNNIPSHVNGLTGITQFAAGYNHYLAIKDGKIWAWGSNLAGQLGNGTNKNSSVPVQVSNLSDYNAIAVAGGENYSMALMDDGTVWAWGGNAAGQLGNNSTTGSYIPVKVNNLDHVTKIAVGGLFSFALKDDGTVWSWGGGLIVGSVVPVKVTPVEGFSNIKEIACGSHHCLALTEDGTVWAWGNNQYGQLGNDSNHDSHTPVQVSGLTGVKAIYCGYYNSFALKNDGTVWAWGWNNEGQLGDGFKINRKIPVLVSNLTDVKEISGGSIYSLALKNDGTVWAWGDNDNKQLGFGITGDSLIPIQVKSTEE